jgi:hypothetical protein
MPPLLYTTRDGERAESLANVAFRLGFSASVTILATGKMMLGYFFRKGFCHGEGQQLAGQGQEEGESQGSREEAGREEKVIPGPAVRTKSLHRDSLQPPSSREDAHAERGRLFFSANQVEIPQEALILAV